MNRHFLLDQLALTEKHIRADAQHLHRQEEIVAELESKGQDSTYARSLLGRMRQLLEMRTADRDRMRAALERPNAHAAE